MRRARELAFDHSADLRKLLHEVQLRVKPPRRVDDDHVPAVTRGTLDRVVGDGGGVRPTLAADEFRACANGPDLELLLGRSAERVSRRDHDRVAVLA